MEKTTARMVKELRDHLGLTQSEFARHIGVSHPTVQRYEREGPPMEQYGTFVDLARARGREDIAGAFVAEIAKVYGRFFDAPKDDRTPTERHYCSILVDMLRTGEPPHVASLKGFLDAWPLAKKQRATKRNAG